MRRAAGLILAAGAFFFAAQTWAANKIFHPEEEKTGGEFSHVFHEPPPNEIGVRLPTRPGVTESFLFATPAAPKAVVILFSGGEGAIDVIGEGPFAIAAGSLAGVGDWAAERAQFWKVNFALRDWRSRSFSADAGLQGHWRAQVFYDAFTRAYTETARSPFNGIGTPILTLPSAWISGASSSQFATLAQDLKPFAAKVAWQNAGGTFALSAALGLLAVRVRGRGDAR